MTKADELWEKYWDIEAYGQPVMTKSDFLAAIKEHGELVKAEAVKVCSEKVRGMCGNNCAAAIEKMKLP